MIETLTPEGQVDLHRVREFTDKPVAANLMIQGWKKEPSIVDVLAEAGMRRVSPRRATRPCSPRGCTPRA
jgi:enoyl-[acyl-carrier protein] reductase II